MQEFTLLTRVAGVRRRPVKPLAALPRPTAASNKLHS